MALEGKTERKVCDDGKREVTVVTSQVTKEEARKMFPYRPHNKYSESKFGGGTTLMDDFALLLNGDAKRCKMCRAPTRNGYLIGETCPDCDGRSEYNGKDPRASVN